MAEIKESFRFSFDSEKMENALREAQVAFDRLKEALSEIQDVDIVLELSEDSD